MALEIKLSQKLGQSLLMTPQLQQAIKLLQLGRLEYKEAIEQELLENPVLEEVADEGTADNKPDKNQATSDNQNEYSESETPEYSVQESLEQTSDSPVDWNDYLERFSDYSAPSGSNNSDNDDRPSLEATLTTAPTLTEHLLTQIRFLDISSNDMPIVLHIIGNLNRSGLLCTTLEEISEACNRSVNDIENILVTLQTLEPVGVAARNLPECLLIQLDALGQSDSLAAKIISEYLEQLQNRKYEQISKLSGIALEQVYEAVKLIQSLEPRPAKAFADDSTRYMIPDIYVYKDGDEYVVSLNEEGLPRLRVNPLYLEMLQKGPKETDISRQYLNERLKSASWLIKSIHQRQHTIFRVTESIVKFQREFLDHGVEYLKPLVLKEVADDIGMHESTVSRVTSNKFVHTPQGVYELKFFFSTGLQSDSGSISSNSIKQKIKNLIAQEDNKDPVSDQFIVEALHKDGIQIARRTVAKYRESLGIVSSAKRKKHF